MRARLAVLLLAAAGAASFAFAADPPAPPVTASPGAAPAAAAPATPAESAAGAPGDVRLEAAADRAAINVGDPITVTVRLIHPQGTKVVSFEPARALEAVTLLDQRSGPGRPLDLGRVEEVRVLVITAYELGRKEIPAFTATCADPSGKEITVRSAPIPFDVASVLAQGQTDPADIKNPAAMPTKALWPWALAGLAALAAAAWLLWRRFRRRPVEAAAVPAAPPRPPHEIAYAELERLLSSGLLEKGSLKEFYIELAEIIRRYLGARYGIDTFERTTSEIMEALRGARLPVRVHGALGEFLAACDLVKFAKHQPAPEETRGTVERAYRLVDETREVPAQAPATPSAAPAGAVAP